MINLLRCRFSSGSSSIKSSVKPDLNRRHSAGVKRRPANETSLRRPPYTRPQRVPCVRLQCRCCLLVTSSDTYATWHRHRRTVGRHGAAGALPHFTRLGAASVIETRKVVMYLVVGYYVTREWVFLTSPHASVKATDQLHR